MIIGDKNEGSFKIANSKSRNDLLVNYEIFYPIGRGTFSFVYKALHRPTNRMVALKVIQYSSEKDKERIQNEINIHSKLNHPNIVKLLDFFNDESNFYLVLENCENGEFYSYVKKNKKKVSRRGNVTAAS